MWAYGHGNLIAFEAANCKDDTENAHARCSSSASVVWRWQCSSPTPSMMTSVSTGVCCITQCWLVPSALGRCQGVGHCPVAPSVCGHDPDLHLYQSRCSALSSPIPPASEYDVKTTIPLSSEWAAWHTCIGSCPLSSRSCQPTLAQCPLPIVCCSGLAFMLCFGHLGPLTSCPDPEPVRRPSSGHPFLSTLKCWV